MSGFHGAFATGVACQQGTLTLPDTWFRPPFRDLLMLQLLRPKSSMLPCLYSTFHIEYPLVLSRFCSFEEKTIVKTVNLKIWKFSFSVHLSKMSSRRQAKLITIYRIPGFSFFISFRFQCNTCVQYAISCFAKTYRNNFASNF